MPTQILMPALSPTMEEGTLSKWLVKEGDAVKSGDIMAEIETDKATMEFEAVDEGIMGAILVAEGSEGVKVNTPIAVLLMDGEAADAPAAEAAPRPAPAAPAAAPSGDQSTASTEEGATAARQDAGAITDYSLGPIPDRITGAPEGLIDQAVPPMVPSTSQQAGPHAAAEPPAAPAARAEGARVFATPLARRIAEAKGLDLATIQGSGPHGRIVKSDVEATQPAARPAQVAVPVADASKPVEAPKTADAPKPAGMPTGPSAETVIKMYEGREFTELKLDGMRKIIAARLTEAKQTIPHFYLRRDIKLDALLAFRAQLNAGLEKRGVKLSVNDFIIKACALALQQVPDANAVWAGDRILRLRPSDVAVAVAVEGGLFTPVLKDADAKSLSALSAEMKDLAARAKTRKLAPQEYQGGSFAISNLGMYGIDSFDAVINPPHGSILAVGAGVKKPVVGANDQVEVATILSVTLSVDHRVIDGALGAQFLAAIKDNLESPMAMLA